MVTFILKYCATEYTLTEIQNICNVIKVLIMQHLGRNFVIGCELIQYQKAFSMPNLYLIGEISDFISMDDLEDITIELSDATLDALKKFATPSQTVACSWRLVKEGINIEKGTKE